MNQGPTPSAWASAMLALGEAGDRLAARVRERGEADGTGDLYLTMLGALMDSYLNQLSVDAAHPAFLPCTGYFQHLGSPNPDTVYRRAPIDAAAAYRITGHRGTASDVSLMAFTEPAMRSWPARDLSGFAHGPDGAIDLIASTERPAGHTGDWLRLEPGMTCLWLRSVSDDWGRESDPELAITRVGAASRQRPAADALEARLAAVAAKVERIVAYGMTRVDELAGAGFVNALKTVDYAASGAMPLQHYHEGLFDLADDEALLVEAEMPADCRYFSWSLTDRMLVTLDWMNAQTSLNRTQAALDPDGVLRVVLSRSDPGAPNWMETSGYRSGVLQCRHQGSRRPPVIRTKRVRFAAVFDHLPAGTRRVTAAARAEALHRRQVGAQLRRLW